MCPRSLVSLVSTAAAGCSICPPSPVRPTFAVKTRKTQHSSTAQQCHTKKETRQVGANKGVYIWRFVSRDRHRTTNQLWEPPHHHNTQCGLRKVQRLELSSVVDGIARVSCSYLKLGPTATHQRTLYLYMLRHVLCRTHLCRHVTWRHFCVTPRGEDFRSTRKEVQQEKDQTVNFSLSLQDTYKLVRVVHTTVTTSHITPVLFVHKTTTLPLTTHKTHNTTQTQCLDSELSQCTLVPPMTRPPVP